VGEVVPGVAVGAVILSDGPPLALTQVRSPFLPGGLSFAVLLEAGLFRAEFVGLVRLHGGLLVEIPVDTHLICRGLYVTGENARIIVREKHARLMRSVFFPEVLRLDS
jgi:hypothetical protein